MVVVYDCPLCDKQLFSLIKQIRHIGLYHESDAKFSFTCGLNGCGQVNKCFSSYRSHLYRKHRDLLVADYESEDQFDIENDTADDSDDDTAQAIVPEQVHIRQYRVEDLVKDLKNNLCLFILKLREKHCIPAVVHTDIIQDLKVFFHEFTTHLSEALKFHLERNLQINIDEEDDLRELLSQYTLIEQCFDEVSSEWMLQQYCTEQLGYISPLQLEMNGRVPNAHLQYIPLLALLQKLAKNEDIWAMLNSHPAKRNEDILKDYTDGEQCKAHPLLCNHNNIRLHFYVDEFEIVNPLGAKRGKHKLTAVYFKLGNIHHRYTSKVEHIYLSILVKHKLIYKDASNYYDVFRPLIDDVRLLETEGVVLDCGRESKRFFGTIASISSDNLSAHAVAGFSRNFSHGRICRFCMATREEITSKFREEEFVMRDGNNYNYHLRAVEEDPENGLVYGVIRPCCFASLNNTPALMTHLFPPDIMHDVLEGVIPFVLKHILNKMIRERILTLGQLNYEIENYQYGWNEKTSKPQLISERMLKSDGQISGSASEKWTLFRLLPLLIGLLIVPNKYWDCYLLLREVVDIIMAPVIRRSWLPYLEEKTTEFLVSFSNLFENRPIPKMHYIVHYPQLIALYGPLVHLSCMRFEAKHQYFKKLSSVVCNFKNITKTLATRHQMRQCWEQANEKTLGKEVSHTGSCSEIRGGCIPDVAAQALQKSIHVPLEDLAMQTTKSLVCNDVPYRIGELKVVELLESEHIPIFLEVTAIYCINSQWFVVGRRMVPSSFEYHLHSFKLEEKGWVALKVGEEVDHHGLDIHCNMEGERYVTLRYWVV